MCFFGLYEGFWCFFVLKPRKLFWDFLDFFVKGLCDAIGKKFEVWVDDLRVLWGWLWGVWVL